MRGWADDLQQRYGTSPKDLQRLSSAPPELLTEREKRILDVHAHLFNDPTTGIKGSLGPDGSVDLEGGRHRARYLLERGVDPIPVWVSAPDQRQLDEFAARCGAELDRQKLVSRSASPPRPEATRTPPESPHDPPVSGDRGDRKERLARDIAVPGR